MKITVAGAGCVGLVTGACLAEMGNDVLCLDIDAEKIRTLNEGGLTIFEPVAMNKARKIYKDESRVAFAESPIDANSSKMP